MRAIYPPRGRAQEYGGLACNLALACDHGCKYCYAPALLRRKPEEFHDSLNVQPRPGIIDALKREAPKYVGDMVFFCFACDPCHPNIIDTTSEAIRYLNAMDVSVMILTKAFHSDQIFLDMEGHPENRFGMTLTLADKDQSYEWEPGAAPPAIRCIRLQRAHNLGIKTWVSLEPVIDPEQSISLIKATHKFVDHYKVGKLNHHAYAKTIDWPKFRLDVVELLDRLGCDYYIKRDLREAK